jgi:hypothetical protein
MTGTVRILYRSEELKNRCNAQGKATMQKMECPIHRRIFPPYAALHVTDMRKNHNHNASISDGHNWEKLILLFDEFDIERLKKTKDTVDALRWIDNQIQNSTYNEEKILLAEKWQPAFDATYLEITEKLHSLEAGNGAENLFVAKIELRSLKMQLVMNGFAGSFEEGEKYLAAWKACEELSKRVEPELLVPLLRLVQSAKQLKHKGRKIRGSPTAADHALLDEMRLLVFSGSTSSAAAQTISKNTAGQSPKATQKRLERWWRWKRELRQYPLED